METAKIILEILLALLRTLQPTGRALKGDATYQEKHQNNIHVLIMFLIKTINTSTVTVVYKHHNNTSNNTKPRSLLVFTGSERGFILLDVLYCYDVCTPV